MRRCKVGIVFVVVLLWGIGVCGADTYTGSLSSEAGEIDGTGFWITDNDEEGWHGVTFSWTVYQNPNYSWHYSYTLDVYTAEVSHMIVETSDPFYNADIFNDSGPYDHLYIDSYTPGGGEPYMPANVYGLKFDDVTGTTVNIAFDSWRVPVWADFYAKCGAVGGTQNTAWNIGFTSSDTDPSDLPRSGSVDYHILAPDSYVPEPTTVALFALGLAGLGARLRKRKDS